MGARDAGVTLVEMLVVLAIVGVMSGVTVLAISSADRGVGAQAEAERLAGRLTLAADAALIDNRRLALQWDARGYRFVAWDARARDWRKAGDQRLGPRHPLPDGLRLDGARSPQVVAIDGSTAPFAMTLTGASRAVEVTYDGFEARAAPRIRP